ncbi:hypothetical protein [Brachybacterium sp. J153]|uniref:hypothetical protein n=1 Tax=Brachybacterium sp. J153 TaxID=3116488 RepID=UPI002E7A1D0A|nr:hypothetical protein [Brachybacterium sp. J153]MEE1617853.1 hypothetical protein [Brachybacterium sp. J153]
MSTRLAAAAALVLFVLGAVVQIWSPRVGLTLMLLGVMVGLASITFMQRTLQRRLIKHERLLGTLQRSVTQGTNKVHRAVEAGNKQSGKYGASLMRRTQDVNDRLKHGLPAGAAPAASPAPAGAGAPRPAASAGRASTPEVTNPFTNETLATMLTPQRVLAVGGIFDPRPLPELTARPWLPGEVVPALERDRPDLILLDEQALRASAVWSSATTGVGTALMRELLEGVSWAESHKVPVYLLRSALPPDVHTAALRRSSAVSLPLGPEELEAAAGAPQTSLLSHLQEIATDRTEGHA